jgi:DUF1365 family protein
VSHFLASGPVWHLRQEPGRHAFAYRMAYLWCDIDALDRGEGAGGWLSSGGGRLFQMRLEDHLGTTDKNWRSGIEHWLERAGIPTAPSIHILSLPRILGRTFNPVSFWIGRDASGEVAWMVAEVNNTFGARHLYALDARKAENGTLCWTAPKAFPVSPFHGVEGVYQFRLGLTDSVIEIGIDLSRHGEGAFLTGLRMDLRPLGKIGLTGVLATLAASVVLTVPRILWHAARLHFGGKARVRMSPGAHDTWTIHQGKPVLLQRLFANPTLGRIWKRLGQILTPTKTTHPGAQHGS